MISRPVVILGAGVVGAAIAYELSRIPGLEIVVLEQATATTWGATGAALGVLVGGLSLKAQGRHVQLRQASLKRWETLIPELEQAMVTPLPYNRWGILELCFDPGAWEKWQSLVKMRQEQGFPLALWSVAEVAQHYPDVVTPGLVGGIFSAQDRQIAPIPITQALRQAARQNGVQFHYQAQVQDYGFEDQRIITEMTWTQAGQSVTQPISGLIIAAGLGSTGITTTLHQPLALTPVLGQALHYRCPSMPPQAWPVIQGHDIHLVPLQNPTSDCAEFWVGATVEFDAPALQPDPTQLWQLQHQAQQLFPFLSTAEIIDHWSGLRPRPVNRAAPVIESLNPYHNIWLTTGHYRNGILLAPITALLMRQMLLDTPGQIFLTEP